VFHNACSGAAPGSRRSSCWFHARCADARFELLKFLFEISPEAGLVQSLVKLFFAEETAKIARARLLAELACVHDAVALRTEIAGGGHSWSQTKSTSQRTHFMG